MATPQSIDTRISRRDMVARSAAGSLACLAGGRAGAAEDKDRRVGIIGLDTSHSVAFTRLLHAGNEKINSAGYRVVAAYPLGSRTIESSAERIPQYTEQIREMGVQIVDSIPALLERVDVVLLETNDGKPRLGQALPVLRAGKPLFVDKPIAASLGDVVAIYREAERVGTPVFSSSALRYAPGVSDVRKGIHGKTLGVATWSPMSIEPSHPDLYWYGIHGVEMLFAALGPGCQTVRRNAGSGHDLTVGRWTQGQLGTFRGLLGGKRGYGGIAYTDKKHADLGSFAGYDPLVAAIVDFWSKGRSPVPAAETIEIYAFMSAADESKRRDGATVRVADVLASAERDATTRLKSIRE